MQAYKGFQLLAGAFFMPSARQQIHHISTNNSRFSAIDGAFSMDYGNITSSDRLTDCILYTTSTPYIMHIYAEIMHIYVYLCIKYPKSRGLYFNSCIICVYWL